jgi:uncharacterized protein YggT (Ycf19 family)
MPGFLFRLIATVFYVFTVLCALRVFASWFPSRGGRTAGVERFLRAATDWWFKPFARIKFLQRRGLDFSPACAIIVLAVPATAFSMLGAMGKVAWGVLLGVVLQSLWSMVAFFLAILILLLVTRLVVALRRGSTYSPFLEAAAALTDPFLYRVSRILFGKRIVRHRTSLTAAILVLAAAWALGAWLCGAAAGALATLPF